jgi:hypothetical protein
VTTQVLGSSEHHATVEIGRRPSRAPRRTRSARRWFIAVGLGDASILATSSSNANRRARSEI